jgi:hypothetical protein
VTSTARITNRNTILNIFITNPQGVSCIVEVYLNAVYGRQTRKSTQKHSMLCICRIFCSTLVPVDRQGSLFPGVDLPSLKTHCHQPTALRATSPSFAFAHEPPSKVGINFRAHPWPLSILLPFVLSPLSCFRD